MKVRLTILHTLLALSLVGVACSAFWQSGVTVVIGLSFSAFIFSGFIFMSWMKYISKLAVQSGSAIDNTSAARLGFRNLDIIQSNHEKVKKRFHDSAAMIANLSQEDESVFTDEKDSISLAIQKIRTEMRTLKEQEGRRLWITQGLARFGEILRKKSELKEYSHQIISNLVKYVQANQGGLFIEYTSELDGRYLELIACYAYEKRKHEAKRISEGQGVLGQCMLEKDFVFLTDVPHNYTRITSGLGDATPRNIVVAPLIFNEVFYGAIELALFEVMKPHEVTFLKEVCENIAAEIASLKNISHTRELLDESNQLTQELKVREEEMKHNLEELAATQEEMANKQTQLTGVLSAINTTLATAEFDTQGSIIGYNSITENIFGFASHEMNQKDFRLITGDRNEVSFEEILSGKINGGDFYTKCANGKTVWLSTTFTVVRNSFGNALKVLCLAHDITESKNASLDFKYKLEAISRSNSVLELDINGQVISANANFLELTNYKEVDVQGKSHRLFVSATNPETPLYIACWNKITSGESVSGEFPFQSSSGKTVWMRGVYNPILDMNGLPVKIVLYASDITEEKRLEQVAQRKQKELNNYLAGINNTIASAEFEPDGTFRSGNEIFLRVLGYQAEDIADKSTPFFMGTDHSTIMMWENLRLGKFFSGEFRMKDKNGRELWLTGTFNPVMIDSDVPQKIVMFAQFITQEKEKLHDLHLMVQALKSTLPVLELNDQLACKTANDKFLKLFGLSRVDFKAKSVFDFIDPSYHDVWNKLLNEILSQEFVTLNLPLKMKAQTHYYEVSISVNRSLAGKTSRIVMLMVREVEEIIPVMAVV